MQSLDVAFIRGESHENDASRENSIDLRFPVFVFGSTVRGRAFYHSTTPRSVAIAIFTCAISPKGRATSVTSLPE